MQRKSVVAWFLALVMAFIAMGSAVAFAAEEKKPTEFIHLGDSDVPNGDGWIVSIQSRLSLFGYYEDETFTPGLVDTATGNALQRYYVAMGMNFSPEGVSPEIQWQILKGDMKKWPIEEEPAPSPEPTPFPVFKQGDSDDAIRDIQQRLSDAGYFALVEESCDIGVLDEGTLKALEAYMKMWNYRFNGVVDENVYLTVMRGNALPTPMPTVTPTPVVFIGYGANNDNRINEIQQRLEGLGYLKSGAYTVGTYDETMSNAVVAFCNNNQVNIDNTGINQTIFDAIFSEGARPQEKDPIRLGDSSAEIEQLQTRLFELNCYEGLTRSGNTCDKAMLKAVSRFAETNNINFNGQEISASVQNDIMNEKAIKWKAPAPEKKNWFLTETQVIGITMPRLVLIIVCVAIVAGLAVLLINTFAKDKNAASAPAGGSSEQNGKANVELQVVFHGITLGTYKKYITTPIHIGRGFSTIPLDQSDLSVSKNHCQLSFHDNTLFLRDFSRNGTRVNGMSIHNQETVVRNNAEIEIGEHLIKVTIL